MYNVQYFRTVIKNVQKAYTCKWVYECETEGPGDRATNIEQIKAEAWALLDMDHTNLFLKGIRLLCYGTLYHWMQWLASWSSRPYLSIVALPLNVMSEIITTSCSNNVIHASSNTIKIDASR